MSDINIPAPAWRKLKKSANCFAPEMVRIAASGATGFSNADLYRAGQGAGVSGLSQHIIGKAMDLNAVTHDTLQKMVRAYTYLRDREQTKRPVLTDSNIVGALLAIPQLEMFLRQAGMGIAGLSIVSSVSEQAIVYACAGNRVTGSIACALHKALSSDHEELPPLEAFATSDPSKAPNSVTGQPFSYEDLLLPLAADVPKPWP